VTSLELFGFGEPEPIALPSPDEILPDVMDSPHPSAQPPAAGTAAPITPMPGSLATQMAGEAPPAVNEPVVAVMEAASAELLAEMQGAPERTMAAGTARLSYDADVESIGWAPLVDAIAAHEPDPTVTGAQGKAWSLVGRAIKAGDAAVSRMVTGSNEGVIDFASGGALVSRHAIGREYSRYYAPGVQLDRDRAAGSWRDRPRRQFEGSRAYTPMWLTELPRGATDVTLVGSDLIDGQPCRHLRASADLQLAARRSRHGMETTLPGHHEHDQVLFEAWLDQEGRLRRVRHVLATWTCEVRFSHFGEIPPLEPPTVTG